MTHQQAHFQLNPQSYLDCSTEMTSVRDVPSRVRCWHGEDLSGADWRIELNAKSLAEIQCAVEFIIAHPVDNMQRTPADLDLPLCREVFKAVQHNLNHGVGFVVVDRLPVDQYPVEALVELYWVLGQLVARPVAQKRRAK